MSHPFMFAGGDSWDIDAGVAELADRLQHRGTAYLPVALTPAPRSGPAAPVLISRPAPNAGWL